MCYDKSSFIIGDIKTQYLGIMLKAPITKIIQQKVAVAFVDNTDFTTSRVNIQQKMQKIIDTYNDFYIATRGYIEHEKTVFYA